MSALTRHRSRAIGAQPQLAHTEAEAGRRRLLGGCAVAAGMAWATSRGLPLAQAQGSTAGVVRLRTSGWVADTPTWVADRLGYFNDHGVADMAPIRVERVPSGREALQALLRGEVEFALATNVPLAHALMERAAVASAHDETQAPVILASLAITSQSHVIITQADRGISAPGDFAGRRVGVMTETASHYSWSQYAAAHGLVPGKVQLVDLPVSELGDALIRGRVDAVVLWDPWAQQLRARLGDRAVVFSTRQLHTANWLLIARRGHVAAQPQVADQVIGAYRRALQLIQSDVQRARAVHAQAAGLDAAALGQLQAGVIWGLLLNWSVVANMDALLDWLSQRPAYAGRPVPQPAAYLEAGPLLRTLPQAVTLPAYLHRRPGPSPAPAGARGSR